jgi:PAS domain S-box-containing protein
MVPATDTTPAFLAVMAVDISDRKRAEGALRASEERWRRMFETSAAGMATARLDGIFTAANLALQRMLDRTEDAIVGRTAMEITHADERPETADVVAKFRSGLLQEYHVEKRYLKRDGSPMWLNITTTLVPPTETADPFLQAIYIKHHRSQTCRGSFAASPGRSRASQSGNAAGRDDGFHRARSQPADRRGDHQRQCRFALARRATAKSG